VGHVLNIVFCLISDFALPSHISSPIKRKLLVLDLNGLLWDSVKHQAKGPNRHVSTAKGIFWDRRHGFSTMYSKRPGIHEFLSSAFKLFDVAIWTCAGQPRTEHMMEMMLTKEERSKLKFTFTQENSFNTKIRRLDVTDGKAMVFLKKFSQIYSGFDNLYGEDNTILVDDSPVKAFANPRWSSLPIHVQTLTGRR
jgi:TFIIF-interacting CTD phosphatase-like protein